MEDGGAVVKGKRTKRHRPHSVASAASASPAATNDSPPRADHQEAAASSASNYSRSNGVAATASASAPVTSSDRVNTEEEEDLANCLIMLAQGRRFVEPRRDQEKFTSRRFLEASPNSANGGYYVYECKTCSKTFPSFQALGGHRASHKKPKLLPATTITTTNTKDEESRMNRRSNNVVLSDEDEIATTTTTTTTPDNRPPPAIKVNHSISNNFSSSNSLSLQLTNRALYNSANTTTSTTTGNKQRVHECSICGAEFASGQALGGHMRRHRGPVVGGSQTAPIVPSASLSLTLHVEEEEEEKRSSSSSAVHPVTNALSNKKPSLDLDLNLPAIPDAEEVNRSETKHVFPGKKQPPKVLEGEVQPPTPPTPPPPAAQAQKQQLVFSPPALVDCHY